jgi:glycosyltransferase involved in cell wall biosynthesis
MPLLSIIIPVYNAEKTISRTLDSLNRISFESKGAVEVIVVNDGSVDAGMGIVESRQRALQPLAMTIVAQPNQGLASARNTGLAHCQGTHIFLLDADDELAFDPVPYLQRYPDASSLGFSVRYFQGASPRNVKSPVRISPTNHLDVFTAENAMTVSSVLFRKNRITSLFDQTMFSLEDWLFWMMNPLIFETMAIFPGVIAAKIHMHGKNMTLNYGTMGSFRTKAAEFLMTYYRGQLTRKQQNNLLIQSRIGLLQQGKPMPLATFLLVPCSLSLYAKLVIYTLTGNWFC